MNLNFGNIEHLSNYQISIVVCRVRNDNRIWVQQFYNIKYVPPKVLLLLLQHLMDPGINLISEENIPVYDYDNYKIDLMYNNTLDEEKIEFTILSCDNVKNLNDPLLNLSI